MRLSSLRIVTGTLLATLICGLTPAHAAVKPGDVITKDNADKVIELLSPGNYILVQEGMQLRIVPSDKLDWPPPFKVATEKYSPQVQLLPDGTLKGYVAGQPFPLLDPNDPQMATKVMWNFSYRPLYSDDIDMRFPEVASFDKHSTGTPLSYYTVGHFAFYNNIGRIEVPPIPTDPDGVASGIRYRFGFYPFLEPSSLRGYGMVRQRHIDPKIDDNVWVYNPETRKLRRESVDVLSDSIGALPGFGGGGGGGGGGGSYGGGGGAGGGSGAGAYANTLDPDSYFGFSAKIEDFNYRFLGEKEMLASVHAAAFAGSAVPVRRRQNDLPGRLGDAPSVRDRSGREAGPRHDDPQANLLHRFGRMVHHGVGSVRSRRQTVEDNRDFQHFSRPAGARRKSRDLSVQADIPVGAGGRGSADTGSARSSICRDRPRPITNAGISTWARWTTPSSRRRRWNERATDLTMADFFID